MRKVAVLMDDISKIKTYKDTTFALMLAAQKRGYDLMIFGQEDWSVRDGEVMAYVQTVSLIDREEDYYQVLNEEVINLATVDVVLQRKDPPFNLPFIYDSYMLELLEQQGVKVINPPSALRGLNEKFSISQVPECTPPTLITKSNEDILDFLREYKDIVLKPLDRMGGSGVFKLNLNDPNINSILDTINPENKETLMLQQFLPAISEGDKRILIINGKAVEYGLLRHAKEGEFRANLAAGGFGTVEPLNERDKWLVSKIQPLLKREKLYFVGLDVIGGFITEINITSPTCMREIERAKNIDIAGRFWDGLEELEQQELNQNNNAEDDKASLSTSNIDWDLSENS